MTIYFYPSDISYIDVVDSTSEDSIWLIAAGEFVDGQERWTTADQLLSLKNVKEEAYRATVLMSFIFAPTGYNQTTGSPYPNQIRFVVTPDGSDHQWAIEELTISRNPQQFELFDKLKKNRFTLAVNKHQYSTT